MRPNTEIKRKGRKNKLTFFSFAIVVYNSQPSHSKSMNEFVAYLKAFFFKNIVRPVVHGIA